MDFFDEFNEMNKTEVSLRRFISVFVDLAEELLESERSKDDDRKGIVTASVNPMVTTNHKP